MPTDQDSGGTPADAPTPPEEVMPSVAVYSRLSADAGVTHPADNTSDRGEASSGAPTLEQRIDAWMHDAGPNIEQSGDVLKELVRRELNAAELLKEARAALLALRQQLQEARIERAAVVGAFDDLAYVSEAEKTLVQRVKDELADFKMVMGHCSEVYDHFSRGRISKPNTLPREVIVIAHDFATEDINEAIAEETDELRAEVARLRAARTRTSGKSAISSKVLVI